MYRKRSVESGIQKTECLIFVGYSSSHKAYRFLDPETGKITISRDAKFYENSNSKGNVKMKSIDIPVSAEEVIWYESAATKRADTEVKPRETAEDDTTESDSESDEASGYDGSLTESPENLEISEIESDYETTNDNDTTLTLINSLNPIEIQEEKTEDSEFPLNPEACVVMAVNESIEPRSYKEAIAGKLSQYWKEAMDEEFKSLQDNRTWKIVQLPPGRKAIGCKWVYKQKLNENGEVIRYKARLVAQGFSQKFGSDYDAVFAPVARQVTLRMILTLAAKNDMIVKHVDVKSAYLNGDLEEEIYMKQPEGYNETDKPDYVCKLLKSLYGLKQSARVWNKTIDELLKRMGLTQSNADPCLYMRKVGEKVFYVIVYVDDLIVCCMAETEFKEFLKVLQANFKITDLGDVKLFLGIQIEKSRDGYLLNQQLYIEKLLKSFSLEECKPSKYPMDPGYLKQAGKPELLPSNDKYRDLIGSLLYLAINTRPDIAVSTSLLSRKIKNPTQQDWNEAKRILKYLKGTATFKLKLEFGENQLEVYVDSDFANSKDRKSNTGYIIKYGKACIDWCCKKQDCISLSSCEAEFVAVAECCMQLIWICKLFESLHIKVDLPVCINEDNQGTIKLIESERNEKRSKHIDIKYCFIRGLAKEKKIKMKYCPTENMIADALTKPLSTTKLVKFRGGMNLK